MNYFSKQHKYNSLNQYLKTKYNSKVFKISLNGNFTCPNRDGSKGFGGCIFCSAKGSGEFAGNPKDDLLKQFNTQKEIMAKKWKNGKYIIYFQANTNTYAPLEKLKTLFDYAIHLDPNIVALSIGTRPDCLDDQIIEYLKELNNKIPVWVELGLQTIHSETMEYLNLCYTLADFKQAVKKLREAKLEVITHIINGLPNETPEMMLETVMFLNTQDIQGLKIHSLFILNKTPLGNIYLTKPFKILTLDEYVSITSKQITLLNANIIIHRLTGDAPKDELIEPLWSLKKLVVMNEIDKYMKINNLYQGMKKEL